MKSEFQFYEIVKITTDSVAGLEGAVLGKAQADSGEWLYVVYIYSEGKSRYLSESVLESTGKFDKRENYYDGTSVKVRVDPDTGEGEIVDKP